jgi:hypothetical protein
VEADDVAGAGDEFVGLAANAGVGIGEGALDEITGVDFGRDADDLEIVAVERGLDLRVGEFTAKIGPVEVDDR